MAHPCNPRTWGGQGGQITRSGVGDQPGQYDETSSLLKNTKISWVWWRTPGVPATPETKAEESLESGGRGFSEPRLCHGTPTWGTEQNSVSKKKKKRYHWI